MNTQTPVYVSFLIGLAICLTTRCSAQTIQQSYASTHIKNSTGKPLSLLNITDSDGKKVAELFISGKDAYFGADQHVVKGSGYIQAEPNKTVTFLIIIERSKHKEGGPNFRQIAVRANRIDWDEDGKTTAISGIAPIVETSLGEKWKIVSSLQKPELKDGVLTIELEQKGKVSFDIRFGNKGTLIGSSDVLFEETKK